MVRRDGCGGSCEAVAMAVVKPFHPACEKGERSGGLLVALLRPWVVVCSTSCPLSTAAVILVN